MSNGVNSMGQKHQEDLEKAKEQLQMAGYAQQVVDNPAYKNAMMVIRADLLDQFARIPHKDIEGLQEIKRRMDTIEQLQGLFERTMSSGRLAEANIGKLEQFINKIRA